MWTVNFQMFKLDLEKLEEPEIKLPTSTGSSKKQEKDVPEKHFMLYWLCQSLWLCVSQQTGKFLKRWEYDNTQPASWEIYMQVKKQQLEVDIEQQTGSNLGKEYVKAVFCHPAYLTYTQSNIMWNARLDEAQAGIKIAGRNINNLRYADDTTLMAESEEELKSLLMKVKEEREKVGLKLNIQKT